MVHEIFVHLLMVVNVYFAIYLYDHYLMVHDLYLIYLLLFYLSLIYVDDEQYRLYKILSNILIPNKDM
jgi:hypothetical protein